MRYFRWQVLVALLGLLLLVILLGYSAYNFTSELVPAAGGTYVEGMAGSPQAINPLLCQMNEADRDLCSLIFEGLSTLDERGNAVPALAEGWEVSPDGLHYRFFLRQDVLWHDGAPFTSEDILVTINAIKDPDFPGLSDLAALWRTVEVAAPDAYTVEFTLAEPFAPFLDYTRQGIMPAHLWESIPISMMQQSQLLALPIGTGPFRVADVSAERVRLEPSPYWRGNPPYLDAVEFRFYADYPRLLTAFQQGEIDGISQVLPEDVARAAAMDDLNLFSASLAGYAMVALNLSNPNVPFMAQVEVRQAFLFGIDRQGLIDTALGGQALLAHSPILPRTWAYKEEIVKYPYDPERARALLDGAGWQDSDGDGVRDREGRKMEFILLGNDLPPNPAIIQYIAQQLAEIGVRAIPQSVTFPALVSDFLVPHRFEAALIHWELPGDPDPYPLWHSTQAIAGQNYGGWDSPTADDLMQQARSTVVLEERRQLYLRFQDTFAEDVPALLLYYPVYTYGVRATVKGVQLGLLNEPGDRFRTIADWYIVTQRVTKRELVPQLPALKP